MQILYISGSPRKKSNTDYLLKLMLSITGGQFVKLSDYHLEPCKACGACLRLDQCTLDDDMTQVLIPQLLAADALVLGSPVYFNNVSAQLKAFMDRTWCLKGKLNNKIGGAVVVGRGYGAESAITAIHAFLLKHNAIPANRGVCGVAFNPGEIEQDEAAIKAAQALARRIQALGAIYIRARVAP